MSENYNADVNEFIEAPNPDDFHGVGARRWREAAADWTAAAQQQRDDERNTALAAQINANRSIFDGLMQVQRQATEEQAQRQNRAAASLLSAYKMATMNGGRGSIATLTGLNDALGFDGKNRAIYGYSILPNGNLMLGIAQKDPSGQLLRSEQEMPAATVYNMARENPGIMTRSELLSMRDRIGKTGKMTKDMLDRDLPMPQDDYDGPGTRTPVGERTATGGTSVNPNWLYGPQRHSTISAFGANGRGGFTNYDSNDATGHQLQVRDSGMRAPEPELSERERIALAREQGQMERSRMNNESREKLQQQKNEAAIRVAETSAGATKSKADAMKYVADVRAKIKEAQSGKGGWTPTAGDLAKLGKLMNYESGLSDDQRNEVASLMSGMAEVMAKGLKNKDDIPPPGKTEVKPPDNKGVKQNLPVKLDDGTLRMPDGVILKKGDSYKGWIWNGKDATRSSFSKSGK